jgi:hypothetical protein
MTYDDKTEMTISQMRKIWDEAAELARRKNAKYKDSWRQQGWRGNLSRIFEKAARLRTMLHRDDPDYGAGTTESARETALDMLNTLTFFIINLDNGVTWGHEEMKLTVNPQYHTLPSLPDWAAGPDGVVHRSVIDTNQNQLGAEVIAE